MDYERWTELADRDAAGELLKPEERAFLRRQAEENPECRAEMDFWQRFADLDSSADDLRARGVAMKALQVMQQGEKRHDARAPSRHRIGFYILGGLAAAAGVAFLIDRGPKPVAPSQPLAFIPVVLSTTEVRVDGAVTKTRRVPEGSTIEVANGTACVEVGPAIFACMAPHSRVRATHVEGPKRRIDLLSGSVAVALRPQPPGARFSVVANDMWSTAVGTAFSVTLKDEGRIETDVWEGKVLVGKERTGELVYAHKLGLNSGQNVQLQPLSGNPEGVEWTALEKVSGKHFRGAVEATPVPETTATGAGSAAAAEAREPAGVVAKHTDVPQVVEPVGQSAEELLQRARQFRREQQWASAATAYRELQRRFPNSPEAHASLVSLGEVELEYLGQSKRALTSFDAYLQQGGPLAVEAELGRIRSLRALGDQQQEIAAISRFLSRHPESAETSALRERLQTIGAAPK